MSAQHGCVCVCVLSGHPAREMVATFSRLSQQVDKSESELEAEIWRMNSRIQRLEGVQKHSKILR